MALTQVSTGGIKDGQVHTADLADAQITAGKLHADALDHTYTLGASGTDHYTFTGEGLTGAVNDATLYLTRGKTYRFVNGNSSGAHPFRIQSVAGAGGTEYNTGVTNNAGAGGSTIIFEVPHDAPDVLYYICTSHAAMNGIFYVTGALADGTVTTAKLADDAVTDAKIANSINTAIAANTAKTTNATHTGEVTGSTALTIADDVVDEANLKVSNSPTNGYFLSAQSGNTGGLTWAESQGTTINNNADNKIISGSGTANTLEAESNLHAVNGRLLIGTSSEQTLNYTGSGAIQTLGAYNTSSINITNNESSGNTSALTFNKIRGTGAVSSGDNMGGINWAAYDGSAWRSGVTVEGKLTSAASNNIPSYLSVKVNSGSANTERIRITPNGVTFNGDTAAANAFDDYEEGTFTPAFNSGSASGACYASGVSYTKQLGFYRKIGQVVYFIIKLQVSSGTLKSGLLQINNLPFNSGNLGNYDTAGSAYYAYISGYFSDTANLPTIWVSPGQSYIQFYNTAGNNFAGSHLAQAAGRMDIWGFYFTT